MKNWLNWHRFSLSISGFAMLFVALVVVVVVFMAGLTYVEMRNVRHGLEDRQRLMAQDELATAVMILEKDLRTNAARLAALADVSRNLSGDELPPYILKTGILPEYIHGVVLYDEFGRALNRDIPPDLPQNVDPVRIGYYLNTQDERVHLRLLIPWGAAASSHTATGYLLLEADLMDSIKALNHFLHLDEVSLSLPPMSSGYLDTQVLLKAFRYDLLPSSQIEAMQAVVSTAMVRLGLVVLALIVLFYGLLIVLLRNPLRRISQHIDALKEGHGALMLEQSSVGLPMMELEKVRSSLNEYQNKLDTVHSDLDEKNRELWALAHHDPLTGVLNRRAFDENWAKVRAVVGEVRLGMCFALFDCDHFKAINDTYGHQVGDEVLKGIALCIGSSLRRGDQLYRLGGDEFAAILLDCREEAALAVAERCQAKIRENDFNALGVKEPIRMSIGLAHCCVTEISDINELQWQADVAVYSAKRPSKGPVVIYEDEMGSEMQGLFSNPIASAVYEAVTMGTGIQMHYQPVVCLQTGRPEYFEALVRISHEDELIMPERIFSLVAARHLEVDLDRAVLRRILLDLHWRRIPKGCNISINLSGPTLIEDELLDWMKEFQRYMAGHRFIIEVTETALITQLTRATQNLVRLREAGFEVALDDFGSGYSSLRYLANMPVDVVKFDINLIRQLLEDRQQHDIVFSLVALIREAGYELVAEGVEDEQLKAKVSEAGFSFVQGWLYGRPQADLRWSAEEEELSCDLPPVPAHAVLPDAKLT